MADQQTQQSQEELMAQQRQAAQIAQQRMQYQMKVQYVENVFYQTDVKTLLTTVSRFCQNALHVSYMDAQNYKAMLTNMLLRFITEASGIEKFAIILRSTLISAIKATIDIVTGQQMYGMGGMQMGMMGNPMMGGMYGMQGMYGMGVMNTMYNMYAQQNTQQQNSDNSEEAQQQEALTFIKNNLQQADPIIFISSIYTLDNIDFSGDKQFEEMLRRAIWFAVQKVAYTNQMVFNNLYVIATSIYNNNQMKAYQEYWKKQMNEQKKDGNNAQQPMMGMYGMNPMMGGMYGMMGNPMMMGGMQPQMMPGMGMDPMMCGMQQPMMGMGMNPMMGGMQQPGMGMDPMMGGMGMQPQMMPGMMGGMDQMGMMGNPMMMSGMQQPMMGGMGMQMPGMGMNPMMGMGMMQPGMNNFAMNGGSSQSNTIV